MGANTNGSSAPPIGLEVEYDKLNAFFSDYTKNISRGGSFIATEQPLPIGTEFIFSLRVPKMEAPLRLNGTVMWVTEVEVASKANPAGMGIEFQYPSDEERVAVQTRIETLMDSELGPVLSAHLLGR